MLEFQALLLNKAQPNGNGGHRPIAPTAPKSVQLQGSERFKALVQIRRQGKKLVRQNKRFFEAYAPYFVAELIKENPTSSVFALSKHLGARNGRGMIWIRRHYDALCEQMGIRFEDVIEVRKHRGDTFWAPGTKFTELEDVVRRRAMLGV